MRRLILRFLVGFLFVSNIASAQIQVNFSGAPSVPMGGTVDVDVSVSDFNQIVLTQYSINWDSTVMKFNSISNVTTVLPQFSEAGNIGVPTAAGVDEGEMTISWSLMSTLPVTVPDNTVLFTATFDMVGEACDATTLDLSSTPLNMEVIDENFNDIGAVSNGFQTEVECDGGGGTNPTPCPPSGDMSGVGVIAPEILSEPGVNVCIPITVDNFVDIQSAQAGFMWDNTVLSYTNTQNYGFPTLAGAFNDTNAANGDILFVWFDGTGVSPETLPNGATLFEICFDVIGNNGDFSFVFTEQDGFNNEFANSFGQVQPDFTDCGSVTIGMPDTNDNFTLIADDVVTGQGGTECVKISAANFNNIASIQTTINWNPNIVDYTSCSVQNFNTTMGLTCANFNFFPPDKLRLTWNSGNGLGITFQDTVCMFEVCYDVIGECDEMTPINFIDDAGVNTEVGDGDGLPVTPVEIINGSLSILCQKSLSLTPTDATCSGDFGSINSTLSGNMGTTTFAWKNSDNVTISTSANLVATAGCYTLCVTDDNGTCTANACIEEGAAINVGTPSVTDADCMSLGQIVVNASGGNGNPLTCSISPAAQEGPECTFVDLPAGQYTITVSDGTCDSDPATVTVGDNSGIDVSAMIENVDCDGFGSIDLTVSGASGCTFSWTGPGVDPDAGDQTELPGGTYNVTVTCGTCTVEREYIVLNEVPVLDASSSETNVSCFGECDGQINLSVSGGCQPYTYSTNPADLTNLCAGSYAVTITDSSPDPQQVVLNNIMITQPSELVVVLDGVVPSCIDTGSIALTVMGGTGAYTFNWDCPNSPDCPIVEDPDGLVPGMYSVVITDENMCSVDVVDIEVEDNCEEPDSLCITDLVVISESSNNDFGVSCYNECDAVIGATIKNAQGPLSITLTNINDGMVVNATEFPLTGICAGTYSIVVTDGVTSVNNEGNNIIITEPEELMVDAEVECSDLDDSFGSITTSAEGGVGDLSYSWTPGDFDTPDLTDLSVGSYFVTLTDENNCTITQMFVVEECTSPPPLECYQGISVITPNGDNVNDFFKITCSTDNPNILRVYDRWGREVYTQTNYDDTWMGTEMDGTELQEGGYFWVMEVEFDNGDTRLFKGSVTLLRN